MKRYSQLAKPIGNEWLVSTDPSGMVSKAQRVIQAMLDPAGRY